jgi:hypothetical protein
MTDAMRKTELWDRLGKTDPEHTKSFTRGGGFRGTAIKPMWSFRRMTEEFGACGTGWGIDQPSFQVVPAGEEILVYCTAVVWHGETRQRVFGVGGDKVLAKNKNGLQSDDEAFKKAFTDAVTNALKLIGVGADVHMGRFDDSKYVSEMRKEFADHSEAQTPVLAPSPAKSSAALKRANSWESLQSELSQDMIDVRSLPALEQLKISYRKRAVSESWTRTWLDALADEFAYYEEQLKPNVLMAGE